MRCLALSKDHLGGALTQGAMMIDFREAEVLERKVTQLLHRFVGQDLFFSDLIKQLAETF